MVTISGAFLAIFSFLFGMVVGMVGIIAIALKWRDDKKNGKEE